MLYSTFYLGDTQMAVPIPCILEIGRSFKFHPVRGAPEVIDGIINLRGKVVTIVNLGLAFEEIKIEPSDESRILIFKNNSCKFPFFFPSKIFFLISRIKFVSYLIKELLE